VGLWQRKLVPEDDMGGPGRQGIVHHLLLIPIWKSTKKNSNKVTTIVAPSASVALEEVLHDL
jgi:hypothetical protein